MSEHPVQSHPAEGASIRPCQSAWMARWMRTCSKSVAQSFGHLSDNHQASEGSCSGKKRFLFGEAELDADISRHVEESGLAAEARTTNLTDERLTGSSKRIRKGRLDSKPFPMFNLSENTESTMALKKDLAIVNDRGALNCPSGSKCVNKSLSFGRGEGQSSELALIPDGATPLREYIFSPKGIKGYEQKQDKFNKFLDNNGLAVSTFLQDECTGSASKLVPCETGSGMSPLQFSMVRQDNNYQSNCTFSPKDRVADTNYHRYSSLMVNETKINNHLDFTRSSTSLSGQNHRTLLQHDPSTSKNQEAGFFSAKYDAKQKYGVGLFCSHIDSPEVTRPEQVFCGSCSSRNPPYSVHDVETMRICTTLDSVEAYGGPPKFSQTMHRFLITKKMDVNLSEGVQMFREPTLSTKVKGKTFSEFLSFSAEGEERKNGKCTVPSAVCLNEESCSETDIMDMSAFHGSRYYGMASSPPKKDLERSPTPFARKTLALTGEEVDDELPNASAANIKQQLTDLPLENSKGQGETSTSRTESLEAEHLVSAAEERSYLKANAFRDGSLNQDAISRWFKRLKRSGSDCADGIRSSKIEKSGENVTQLEKVMKWSTSSPKKKIHEQHHGEQTPLDSIRMTVMDKDSMCSELERKSQEINISHPWIRRWYHNQDASEYMVTSETHFSNLTIDTLPGEKFPSIAAMALVGKSMNVYRPCEFTKRGSLLIWNTIQAFESPGPSKL